MLGKLLKYEIPAMGRKLLPLYAAWAVTALILGISAQSASSKSEFIVIISGLLYGGIATAIMVMALVLIVQRYSNSLLGDEAYFNQVLPVSVSTHIWNKLLSALVWVLITVLIAMLTGVLIGLSAMIVGHFNWSDLHTVFRFGLPDNFSLYVLEFIILMIAGVVKTVMQIYAAITIGHQASNHTTLASIGAYILVLMFESSAARLIGGIIPGFMEMADNGITNFNLITLFGVLASVGFSAVYFLICKYLMEKRLNLA